MTLANTYTYLLNTLNKNVKYILKNIEVLPQGHYGVIWPPVRQEFSEVTSR